MKRRITKAAALILTVALAACLCSCQKKSHVTGFGSGGGGGTGASSISQVIPTTSPELAASTAASAERVRLIYSDFEGEGMMPDMNFTDDLNGDGAEETVTLTTADGEFEEEFHVNIGVNANGVPASAQTRDGYCVMAVYLVDLDLNDRAKEIAVFMMCESADPELEIFRYNGGLNHMTFNVNDFFGELYETEEFGLGYVSSYPFEISGDNIITLQTQTTSRGMWDVYTYYKVDERGYIVEVPQDVYEVVDIAKEFMTDDSGYAAVNKTITGRGLDLYAGDRITILKDDGNNNIFLQKSTGESGWFAMYGWNDEELYEVSELFLLAG